MDPDSYKKKLMIKYGGREMNIKGFFHGAEFFSFPMSSQNKVTVTDVTSVVDP
jgi:hypothetical protein